MSVFEGRRDREDALREVVGLFESIAVSQAPRPKVAIFGALYTRDNDVINQGLIAFIEANGGEAVTMPYSEYLKMIAKPYLRKWLIEGHYLAVLSTKLFRLGLKQQESAYYRYFQRILNEPEPNYMDAIDTDPELASIGVMVGIGGRGQYRPTNATRHISGAQSSHQWIKIGLLYLIYLSVQVPGCIGTTKTGIGLERTTFREVPPIRASFINPCPRLPITIAS